MRPMHDAPRLSFRPKKKTPIHRLPFVGSEHTENGCFSFWNLPAAGGYQGGFSTGKAVALMYLKHLRGTRQPDADMESAYLIWMVDAWTERMFSCLKQADSADKIPLRGLLIGKQDTTERAALRGQMAGFLSVLSECLSGAVRTRDSSLNQYSNESLLDHANAGICFAEASPGAGIAACSEQGGQP